MKAETGTAKKDTKGTITKSSLPNVASTQSTSGQATEGLFFSLLAPTVVFSEAICQVSDNASCCL
jgi:hypothetical protein